MGSIVWTIETKGMEDRLVLNDALEPTQEENQTSVGIYEGLVSLLSDPSQLLYKAVESGEEEYYAKLTLFYRLQKLDAATMPYIRDT